VRAGQEDAFAALFSTHFKYVWASLRRLGVRPADLEDVAHEVFLAVHRHFAAYDPARAARPWLFAFCLRFASDYRKSARIRHHANAYVDAPDPEPLADARLEEIEARDLAREALESIDLSRRAVFILFEIDEVPMNEIASSLGVPLHTAYSRLRVAREEFERAVRRLAARRGQR
jgi:RNA polymerase sigma-70 factor (ECF subfamily)